MGKKKRRRRKERKSILGQQEEEDYEDTKGKTGGYNPPTEDGNDGTSDDSFALGNRPARGASVSFDDARSVISNESLKREVMEKLQRKHLRALKRQEKMMSQRLKREVIMKIQRKEIRERRRRDNEGRTPRRKEEVKRVDEGEDEEDEEDYEDVYEDDEGNDETRKT